MSIAGAPARDTSLWECALECALRRQKGRCICAYSRQCDCEYNVAQYGDFSDSDLQLFMLQARKEACYIKGKGTDRRGIAAAIIFGIIALITYAKVSSDRALEQGAEFLRQQHALREGAPQAGVQEAGSTNINLTLNRVSVALKQGIDVNNDGLINCIDAAVLFYQYYPDKSRVCIEVNLNPVSGWHHLFNCVLVNGSWIAVEPQSKWMKRSSYRVKDIWAVEYDRQYNRDVTDDYVKYVR